MNPEQNQNNENNAPPQPGAELQPQANYQPAAGQMPEPPTGQIPPTAPSTGLSVAALLLSVSFNIVGLIMSIIIFVKSKKAGVINGLAVAGIVVGSLTTLFGVTVVAVVVADIIEMSEKCTTSSQRSYIDKRGAERTCTASVISSDDYSVDTKKSTTDIADTTVSLVGDKVSSTCWTFAMPAQGYALNKKSSACTGRIVIDQGNGTGDDLGAVNIKAQTGDMSVEKIRASYDDLATKGAKIHSVTDTEVNGKVAVKIVADDWMGLKLDIYIVIDDSETFSYDGKPITSYMISGHSYNATLEATTTSVVQSFAIK